MDPKAAAKSKRSHTVHGRRAHQTPAAAAAHKQKRAGASGPRRRDLPSNWDRYDAEGEADDPAAAAEWTGEVTPRSKGADFSFLLEQGRTQPRVARDLSKPWLPSQDAPFDFLQASTSMLEAKGEEILSWCDDDNFILEDDLAPDFEVPFLSMDLHALGNQLSKLKLSQRLFIEEDLLPEDLAGASEDHEVLIECDTSSGTDAKSSLDQDQYNLKNIQPGKDKSDHEHASIIFSDNQTETVDELQCLGKNASMCPKINAQSTRADDEEDRSYKRITDTLPVTGCKEELKLEVASAEEELDMLLNSFSGTHLSGSNLDEPFGHNSDIQGMKISESDEKASSNISSKRPAFSPVGDDLDGLLSEASLSVQNEGFTASNITSQPTLKSGHNVEFKRIRKIDVITSIDDSVDDLLEDTSSCLNEPKQTTSALGQNNTSSGSTPHSGPSNVTDDFDSWFDSL